MDSEMESDSKMEVPVHNVPVPGDPNEGVISKLCKILEPIIWVLKVNGATKKNEEVEHYFTGFTVSEEEKGLVMTTTHLWSHLDSYKVSGRRLNENQFNHILKVHKYAPRWDIALFEVDGKLTGGGAGEFAQNGSLKEGDLVIAIANPKDFIGSVTVGSVCFPCIDVNIEELVSSRKTCNSFDSKANDNNAYDKTPKYRMLGHIWNVDFFDNYNGKEPVTFEKQLRPEVPIIQCNGLNCSVGSVGAPIFRLDGKIVGMVTKRSSSYDVAIHVCVLRHYFSLAENLSEIDVNVKFEASRKHESWMKRKQYELERA